MPVLAAARIIGITDQRLWHIIEHYVGQAVARLDLGRLEAVGLDETASKRGHNYVTVFIDLDAKTRPVVFVTPGKGKDTLAHFAAFLAGHGGESGRIVEVVCDISSAFLAAIGETFESAQAYMSFPKEHRTKLHSTNPLERLNGEIKRRTNVVGIFPNEAAITRLIGAILLEQNDEWAVQRAAT